MKKSPLKILMCLFVAALYAAAPAVYAADTAEANPVEKVSDWAATLGKDGAERDRILAQRKAERKAKKAEKEMRKNAKKAEKDARKAAKQMEKGGKDMKKKMEM